MAQTNMYLKLDGIDGESVDTDHNKWIEIESWNWGVANDASFAIHKGGQSTQAHIHDFRITKYVDNSSVTLFQDSTTGKHILKGTLSQMKLDGDTRVEYMKIVFDDIIVTAVDFAGGNSEQGVTESVAFSFAKFKQTYKQQENTGSAAGHVEFGWDIQASKKV